MKRKRFFLEKISRVKSSWQIPPEYFLIMQ